MFFFSLRTAAFRNLKNSEINTDARDIFLIGENGQGKTNFLEAIYFCCYGSSFRGVRDAEITHNGDAGFSAAVKITDNTGFAHNNALLNEVFVKYEKGKKHILINGKKAEDRKDLLSIAPCIVFCHEDMDFISGSPERRRWFFDQVLSLYDPVYLDDFRRFRRVLKIRNTALRDNVQRRDSGRIEPLLDALDVQFIQYGTKLMEKRMDAVRLFSQVFGPLYRDVSGIDGIAVQYVPSWKPSIASACTSFDDAAAAVTRRRPADIAAGISLSGPHRDRYEFICTGGEFTGKASTGQRRLLALLLRVAQARRFLDMTGKKPVLLLDDVLLEMDGEKRQKFISVMPEYNQAFYTFLPDEPFQRYRKDDTLVYYMNKGAVS